MKHFYAAALILALSVCQSAQENLPYAYEEYDWNHDNGLISRRQSANPGLRFNNFFGNGGPASAALLLSLTGVSTKKRLHPKIP